MIFGPDLVVLEALVALQHDPVDHRILLDDHGQRAIVIANFDLGEELARIEIAQRRIERLVGIGAAHPQLGVGEDGVGLEALGTFDLERKDRSALCNRRGRGCGRTGAAAGAGGGAASAGWSSA